MANNITFFFIFFYLFFSNEKFEKRKVIENDSFHSEKEEVKISRDNNEDDVKTSLTQNVDPDLIAAGEKNPSSEQGEIGDYILIDFDGYCNPNDENDIDLGPLSGTKPFIHERNWLITLGNGDVLPGMEMAIRFLKVNQCGIVKCHSKYAYGLSGRKGAIRNGDPKSTTSTSNNNMDGTVPPDMNVIYKVKIKSIIQQHDTITQSINFQIKSLEQMKNIGNHYYKNDWVDPDGGAIGKNKALKLYSAVAKEASTILQDLEHGSLERRTIFYITTGALNNIAALHLREKEYRKAKDAATQVIQLDPYNLKALCRAAKAALMIGEFEECKMALDVAEDIVENVETNEGYTKKDVQRLKREYVTKKKEYKKLEKEIFAQMLSKKDDSKSKKSTNRRKPKKIPEDNKQPIHANSGRVEAAEQKSSRRSKSSEQTFLIYMLVPIIAIAVWFWARDQSETK